MPAPFNTIDLSATRKYLAGTTYVIARIGAGMLAIGYTNPDSIIVGRNDASSAIWKAACCESAAVEIIRPRPSAPARYSESDSSSRSHDPFIGRSNSTIDARMMPIEEHMEMQKDGRGFPTIEATRPSGAQRPRPPLPPPL